VEKEIQFDLYNCHCKKVNNNVNADKFGFKTGRQNAAKTKSRYANPDKTVLGIISTQRNLEARQIRTNSS
jgi:hypothetical protein